MCICGISDKSVGNDSGLLLVATVLLYAITVSAPVANMSVSSVSGKYGGMNAISGKWVGGKCGWQYEDGSHHHSGM